MKRFLVVLSLVSTMLMVLLCSCAVNTTGVISPLSNNNSDNVTTPQNNIITTHTQSVATTSNQTSNAKVTIAYAYEVLPYIVGEDNFKQTPDPGNSYVVFNFVITNQGYGSAVEIDPIYFSATFAQVQYSSSFISLPNSLGTPNLLNGGTTSGLVVFEVPTNATSQPGSVSFNGFQTLNIQWISQGTTISPTLVYIDVEPSSSTNSMAVGSTQQFTATGTNWDGTTEDITNQVTWVSDTPSVITINSSGLATCVSNGNDASITASMDGVTSYPVLLFGPNV
jgi:hypothetical protein